MRVIHANGQTEKEFIAQLKQRSQEADRVIEEKVTGILAAVQKEGDAAVDRFTLEFDGFLPEVREVTKEQMKQAYDSMDPAAKNAMIKAHDNIRSFHSRQKTQGFMLSEENGVIIGQKVRGLKRVGIYVPGGRAAYPSTVLMNAIPAKIAGVEEIIMVTPPKREEQVNPVVLAAAYLAGVDRVFLLGGAQAVAALAYGTNTIPAVDKIVGPGNIFVATAKKLLYGRVDIDMIAGPSEILVLADETANPDHVAADLMSQAEHDPMASAMLVTCSKELARQVEASLYRQMEQLERRSIIAASIRDYGAIFLTQDMEQAINLANLLAPEHLEVMTANPFDYLGRLHNAGSIFLGHYAPEPLGDYYAGPNHVLPTNFTARFFSPLSVDSFVKRSSYIYYTKDAFMAASDHIITLANQEGLTAHAHCVAIRVNNE
jgi:histidinol dehydrogenase